MSPQTRRNDLWKAPMRFWGAMCLSLLLTGILLGAFVFTWPGTPQDFRSELFFWGSILRQQELVPEEAVGSDEEKDVRIVSPSPILAPLQARVWSLGSAVEKPESLKVFLGSEILPPKFSAERVDLGGVEDASENMNILGIPEPPRIFLRRTGK